MPYNPSIARAFFRRRTPLLAMELQRKMSPERFFYVSAKKLRVAVADHAGGRKFRPVVFVLLG